MTIDNRGDILRKISKLLSKAESTNFGPERDALLEKVDQLRTEHAVLEWELEQAGTVKKVEPESRIITVYDANGEYEREMVTLFGIVCKFFGVKPVFYGVDRAKETTARCIGFPDDLSNVEHLYVSLRTQLATNLSPKFDHLLSIEENVKLFKEAGYKWTDLWAVFYEAGAPGADTKEVNRSRLISWQKKYKNWCLERGITPVQANPLTYRRNFMIGFNNAISTRIYEIIAARENTENSAQSTSTALALVDRSQRVEDKYQEIFGHQRLGSISRRQTSFNGAAMNAGKAAGHKADLGGHKISGSKGELR